MPKQPAVIALLVAAPFLAPGGARVVALTMLAFTALLPLALRRRPAPVRARAPASDRRRR